MSIGNFNNLALSKNVLNIQDCCAPLPATPTELTIKGVYELNWYAGMGKLLTPCVYFCLQRIQSTLRRRQ